MNDSSGNAPTGASLTISLSVEETIDSGGAAKLQLHTTVINVSNQAISLLPWNTPLDSRVTGDFLTLHRVVEGDEIDLEYQGPQVKRRAPTAKDRISILAGKVFKNSLNITKSYNFCTGVMYNLSYKGELTLYSPKEIFLELNAPAVSFILNEPNWTCQ